jgi:hypothetical protein
LGWGLAWGLGGGRGNLRVSVWTSYDVQNDLDTLLRESAVFQSRKRLPKT